MYYNDDPWYIQLLAMAAIFATLIGVYEIATGLSGNF